jgi:hypothetical protein
VAVPLALRAAGSVCRSALTAAVSAGFWLTFGERLLHPRERPVRSSITSRRAPGADPGSTENGPAPSRSSTRNQQGRSATRRPQPGSRRQAERPGGSRAVGPARTPQAAPGQARPGRALPIVPPLPPHVSGDHRAQGRHGGKVIPPPREPVTAKQLGEHLGHRGLPALAHRFNREAWPVVLDGELPVGLDDDPHVQRGLDGFLRQRVADCQPQHRAGQPGIVRCLPKYMCGRIRTAIRADRSSAASSAWFVMPAVSAASTATRNARVVAITKCEPEPVNLTGALAPVSRSQARTSIDGRTATGEQRVGHDQSVMRHFGDDREREELGGEGPVDDPTLGPGVDSAVPATHWREWSDTSPTDGRTRDTPRGADEDASRLYLGETAGQRGCGGVRRQGLEPRTR